MALLPNLIATVSVKNAQMTSPSSYTESSADTIAPYLCTVKLDLNESKRSNYFNMVEAIARAFRNIDSDLDRNSHFR